MALTKVKAGNIILTTPGASSNDVTPATTQYVTTAIGNLIDTAPSTLNTLNELAAALGDDVNFSTTVTNSIATKLPLAGGTLTGGLTVQSSTDQLRLQGTSNTNKNVSILYNESGDYGQINVDESGVNQKDLWVTGLNLKFGRSTSSESMRIGSSGNVGIGTDSPVNAKLEIESSTDQGLLIQLKNTDQDSNTYMRYKDWAGQYWDTGINWANNDYYFKYGGAFKARFTNAGGLQIDGSGASTAPTLALNSTTSTTFNHSINAFNANLASGENQLIAVGQEGSTKNSGYIGYKWISSGNNGNMLTFGHWGNDNIMNLTADGKLGIGTTGPIATLDVRGAVSSIIAMTSAHGYSSNRNWRFVSNNFGSGNWGGFSLERSTGTGGTPSVPVWGIDINGNTGIGIGGSAGATQAAAKLDVGGTIRAADGILFGTDTAVANRLDDYEEGTFTPVVEDGTYTYSNRRGHYTKIGNIVHIHIGLRLASASPGGSVGNISGLPFTSITYGSYQEPHGRIGAGGLFLTANLGSHLTFYKGNSNTQLYARTTSTNADSPINSNGIWQAGTFIKLQMSYTVS